MNLSLKRLLLFLLLGSFSSAFVGCTEPATDQNQLNHENGDAEADLDSDADADGDGEQSSRIEQIPAHMTMEVSPARFVYAPDTRVTPRVRVYNYNWVELSDYNLQWTVSPESSVEKDEDQNRWYLREEGEVTFKACAEVPALFNEVCASRTVMVAMGGPKITLERPLPGEHFDGAEYGMIPVEGVVSSPVEISRVEINGEYVEVDADRRFSHQVQPHFGVNQVTVRAFDGLHPVDGIAAASVIWAPSFHPVHHDSEEQLITTELDDAIILQLGQNFFDNGEPPVYISDSHILTEDLADIIYLVLTYLDLQSQLPDPVVDTSSFVLSVPNVIVENPRVEIDVTDSGLQLYAQIQDLVAETSGFLELSDQTLDLSGQIVARLSIFADVQVSKESPEEPISVELVDFQLAIEGAEPNFAAPEANAIFELANSALRQSLEDILLDSVDLAFIDTLPDLLIDIFTSLEDAMAHQEFDLDLGFGAPLLLTFSGQIGQLLPIYREGLEGFVSAQLQVSAENRFPDNPGIALLQDGPGEFPFFSASSVQIGLNLALINAIFHNLWSAGLLDLEISDVIPANFANLIRDARARGKLPPVAAPPRRDEAFDLMLHVGQFELDLDWNDRTDRFGAAISVGIDLNIANDSIAIEISSNPVINLWLIDTTASQPLLDADALRSLIRTQIWPQLEAAIGEGLSFGLPIPEISGLDSFAPALSGLDLDIRMLRPMEERSGFLMLEAGFEGELFLP